MQMESGDDHAAASDEGGVLQNAKQPEHIRVLELLSKRECSVGELLRELDVEAADLSQQLAGLRRAGVITTRKGSTVYYSLINAQIAGLMAVARSILTSVLSEQAELLTTLRTDARTARRSHVRRGAR